MEIVYLLIGLLIGASVAYLVLRTKEKEKYMNFQIQQQQEINRVRLELERTTTQLEEERKHNEKETVLRQEQMNQQLETVREQLVNAANKILDQTTDKLKGQNMESMGHLTKPLIDNMAQLEQAIHRTNQETAKNTASLSEQLKSMVEHTDKIDATATRLANVMRGANKAQGSWGELALQNLLDSQGLRLGIDYDIQQTITDEKGMVILNEDSGRRMIPDVILHYPNNEDVVIDAKMSIEAYSKYMNEENEDLKRKYAEEVVRSIRTQYQGLVKKDYSRYIKKPRRAIDFVIMYVPYDGALQLALETDPKLWSEAFDKQVFITSQQNLMAILKIIQIAWRQYSQTENQKKTFELAEEMLKRVGDFIKKFDKLGKDIDTLHNDYTEAYKKAYTGRQSIVQKANELKELGVKETAIHPIPTAVAELEA
uniref:DNA recombination protein RmuC n=1 Tax=Prevotella sp. GTC17254 TaxID=3236794 RepID=A0AB33J1Y2_9BACT